MEISSRNFSVFRLAFGLLMIPQITSLLPHIHDLGNSSFVFHYPYLSSIEAYSHELIDWLGRSAMVGAVLLAFGIIPRIGALLFLLSFGYLFLIDQSFYNNHYYLWILIAFLFVCVKTNHSISVIDLFRGRTTKTFAIENQVVFGILITIVYFYGGVAKLTSDWLSGYPMILLAKDRHFSNPEFTGLFLSYAGLIFDLFIGFLLWYKPKKWFIYVPYFTFHLLNYFIFNIGEFPIVMMAAWLLFPPLADLPKNQLKEVFHRLFFRKKVSSVLFLVFFGFQVLFPLRSFLAGPDVSWHRQGYNFSWRMMVNNYNVTYFQYLVSIPDKKIEYHVDFEKLLTYRQFYHAYHEPYMIWQLAQKLKADAELKYHSSLVRVYCKSTIILNNRPEKRLIHSTVDLAKKDYKLLRKNNFINY